jgi:hypothetical protein
VLCVRLQVLRVGEQLRGDHLAVLRGAHHRRLAAKRVEGVVRGLAARHHVFRVFGLVCRAVLARRRNAVRVLGVASHAKVAHAVRVRSIAVSAVDHARLQLLDALHALVDSHVFKDFGLVHVLLKDWVLPLRQSAGVRLLQPKVVFAFVLLWRR